MPPAKNQTSMLKTFALCVCTRERMRMLKECLRSISKLKIPEGWQLKVIIIDNNHEPSVKHIVEDYNQAALFDILYCHQPDPGIPQARNSAIDFALELEADYIGFVDDDEVLTETWLMDMKRAFDNLQCDVIKGPVKVYDDSLESLQVEKRQSKERKEGDSLKTTATNNVAFHKRLIAAEPDGYNLRFNPDMRFTGGEDTEFFFKATDLGATIKWSNQPIVFEQVLELRMTVKWQINRFYRTEANASWIYVQRKGTLKALMKYIPKVIFRILLSLVYVILSLLIVVFHAEKAKRLFISSGKYIMSALGALSGLARLQPQPYAKIEGD